MKSKKNYSSLQTGCLEFSISVLLLTQLLVDRTNTVNTTVRSKCTENSEMFWKQMQDCKWHIPYQSVLSNTRNSLPSDTASQCRSSKSLATLLWQPQISQNTLTDNPKSHKTHSLTTSNLTKHTHRQPQISQNTLTDNLKSKKTHSLTTSNLKKHTHWQPQISQNTLTDNPKSHKTHSLTDSNLTKHTHWQPQISQNTLTFSSYCPSTPCNSSSQSHSQSSCPNLVAVPCCN